MGLRLSICNIGADDAQVFAGDFESLLGVMPRNETDVVIERHVPLASETVEDSQQASMSLVDPRLDELDDRDVMPWLAPRTKTMTKHKSKRGLQHRFVRLLKGGFFVKSQNLASGDELLLSALQETFNLCPVYLLWL